MTSATRRIVEAALEADPTVDRSRVKDGLSVIDGVLSASAGDSGDSLVSRKDAAEIIGCCPQTITLYVRRGLIRPVRLGPMGARAVGYSLRSVREAISK